MGDGTEKPIVWLQGEIKTPPFSRSARIEAGTLLWRLQNREMIGMPHSRPMRGVGARCHELRVRDADHNWRILYRIDSDAIVIGSIFAKKTGATPKRFIESCRKRFSEYDKASQHENDEKDST